MASALHPPSRTAFGAAVEKTKEGTEPTNVAWYSSATDKISVSLLLENHTNQILDQLLTAV